MGNYVVALKLLLLLGNGSSPNVHTVVPRSVGIQGVLGSRSKVTRYGQFCCSA